MTVSTFVARAKKALRMPPRVLAARLRESLRAHSRRPWSQVYPRVLRDQAILGESGAATFDALWARQMAQPFFLQPADRDAYVAAFRARYPEEVTAVLATADAAMRHEFDLLGSGVTALGPKLPWLDDFKTGRRYPVQYLPRHPVHGTREAHGREGAVGTEPVPALHRARPGVLADR